MSELPAWGAPGDPGVERDVQSNARAIEITPCDLDGVMRGLLGMVGREVIVSVGLDGAGAATGSIVGALERVIALGDELRAPLAIMVGEGAVRVTPAAFRAGWRYRFRSEDERELAAVALVERRGLRIECHELAR